ncbi:rab15 effector protein-like [Protopterus annectens]|uniref:rab15 effector protein-like n=1 Tax=Protopterus annectens TaxID=7888 RepID=UPI001CF986D6|nr:rab15 effector protein-like [Protopterus annectens]
MGQNQVLLSDSDDKFDRVCDIFTQAVLHSCQKVKTYLGFVDPEQKLYVRTRTLNEIFLMDFINYCKEKGADDWISTCKMTKQQEMLMGVDWIWNLTGSGKNTNIQIAVQTVQLSECYRMTEMDEDPYEKILEKSVADLDNRNKTKHDKLLEFCSSIGQNCMGLCIIYGVPGKPKEIRGIMMQHLKHLKGKTRCIREDTLLQYMKTVDYFITTREMMEKYLFKKRSSQNDDRVYVNFL